MVKIVLIVCVAIVVWVAAICIGYNCGNDAGYDYGLGRAKYEITDREMKSYSDGYVSGFWWGRETDKDPIAQYMRF